MVRIEFAEVVLAKAINVAEHTVIHIFWDRVNQSPNTTCMFQKTNGTYSQISWRETGSIVERLSAALVDSGIEYEDKVAIISGTSPKWTWADLAILSSGAVSLPVYPSLSEDELYYVLEHSDAKAAFLENGRQLTKLLSITKLSTVRFVVLMDEEPVHEEYPLPVITWDQFLATGARRLKLDPDCVYNRVDKLDLEALATIVHTSGTTGVPKGAMISHGNIYYVCKSLSENIGFSSSDVALSFLPLSHIFERVGGQFLAIYEGIPMAYAESLEKVSDNITEIKPTVMNAVPRFYEKAYNRIQNEIRKLPTPQQYFARWALSIGRRALKAEEEHANNGRLLAKKLYRAELRIAERFVFRKIRERFGGRLRFLVSGAAPLSPEVHQFFESIGIPVLEGYGLTETTAPIACNRPARKRSGTVGVPLPGVEIQIAPDGEILVRGPNVFSGYFKNEEASKAAFNDGWFLTGDIGEFDKDGYLRVKDRKKDIIVTAGGKKIAPQAIENMLSGRGLISRVFVYGDKRKYISALITLNADELKAFAARNEIEYANLLELVRHPQVTHAVQAQIDEANARLGSFERIKRFAILDNDFSVESEELTPTLKIKRRTITEKYWNLLDGLYEKEDIWKEDPQL